MQRQHRGSHRVEHAADHKDDVFVFGGRRLHSLQVAQIQQVHQGEFQKVEHEQDAASVGGALLEDAIGKSVVENAKQKCRQRVLLRMSVPHKEGPSGDSGSACFERRSSGRTAIRGRRRILGERRAR